LLNNFLYLLGKNSYLLVICSDDSIDKKLFCDFETFYPEPGPPIHLSYLMCCDYILGTAGSSFVQIASLLGNVPHYQVDKENQDKYPNIADIKVSRVIENS